MSYASIAQLAQDAAFQDRVRVCAYIECQEHLDDPDHLDWSNVAYDTLRGAENVMDAYIRIVARTPAIADAAGDPPDQSQISDEDIQVAVGENFPMVASMWYMPNGQGFTAAYDPDWEPPPTSGVSGIDPTTGVYNTATDVTISGFGLTGTTSVNIGADCQNLVVVDDATVTATVPYALDPGTYDVLVTVGDVTLTSPVAFTVAVEPLEAP